MAKISALPPAASINGTEMVVAVKGGTTVRIPMAAVVDAAGEMLLGEYGAAASAQAAMEARQSAETARDLSQQYAADAAQITGVSVPIYASVATLQGADIPAGVKSVDTQYRAPSYADLATLKGGARYSRMSKAQIDASGYPAATYLRSSDRFMPDGSGPNEEDGGYWVLSGPDVRPEQLGSNNTAALQAAVNFAVARALPVVIDDVISLTGTITVAGDVTIRGKGVLQPSTSAAITHTAGHLRLEGLTIAGGDGNNARGVHVPATVTSGDLTIQITNIHMANLTRDAVLVDAGADANIDLRIAGLHGLNLRSLVLANTAARLTGYIVNSTGRNLTRAGLFLGTNLETSQRDRPEGITVQNVTIHGLANNDPFPLYGIISYVPRTKIIGCSVIDVRQAGAGDNEGIYTKAWESIIANCILIDAGTGEGFVNVKGHGRPEASYATKALADANVGTLNIGALVRIMTDESRGGATTYYQVNADATALVLTTAAHGYGVKVSSITAICTDGYASTFSTRAINAIKVNTDDVQVSVLSGEGRFRHLLLTAGGQTVDRLQASNLFGRNLGTPASVGAIQLSAPKANDTTLHGCLIENAPNADAVQIAGGEDGAEYVITDLTARGVARGFATRPAADDTVSVRVEGGRMSQMSSNPFYLHNKRLKNLAILDPDIEATLSLLFGGNNKLTMDFFFRARLGIIDTSNATITEYARFPVPYNGSLRSTITMIGQDATDTFEKTINNLHRSIAGAVEVVGPETSLSSKASSGAASWATAVSIVTDAFSGAQMIRARVTGQADRAVSWRAARVELESMAGTA